MAITEQQFKYLNTMGITVWQSHTECFADLKQSKKPTTPSKIIATKATDSVPNKTTDSTTSKKTLDVPKTIKNSVEEKALDSRMPFVKDLLLAFSNESNDVTIKDHTIVAQQHNIEIHFSATNTKCEVLNNQLHCPSIDAVQKSASMKQELWLLFSTILNKV